MKNFSVCLILAALAFSSAVEAKLYKWVDDKGVTHYGEVIPPEYSPKNSASLNDKGRLVKKNDDVDNKERLINAEDEAKKRADHEAKLEQRRKDTALLNTFTNEKEIDLARDRNLHQIESVINSVRSLQKTAQENLKHYQQEAEERKRANKKIPASLQADITESENKLAKLQQDLVKAQEKAAAVKASYDADKLRFHELTGGAPK
jgi:myosin heavy subunit